MATVTSSRPVGSAFGQEERLHHHRYAPFLSVIGTKCPPSWTRISPTSSISSGDDSPKLELPISSTPSSAVSVSSPSLPVFTPPEWYASQRQRLLDDLKGKHIYVFLDYDGTLTPIVSDPCEAKLSPTMRKTLLTLASLNSDLMTVGIVTGRALHSVQQLVQISATESLNFLYAASHGFHIEASGRQFQHRVGLQYIPLLREAALKVAKALGHIEGVTLEDNEYAVSVHYRNAPAGSGEVVENLVDAVLKDYPSLKKTSGKMVLELRINVVWDKGKAVEWLLKSMEVKVNDAQVRIMYVGDDLTDEDAFRTLQTFCKDTSVSILVSENPESRPTCASLFVRNPDEVASLLQDLILTIVSE